MGTLRFQPRGFHRRQGSDDLAERLRRAARLRRHDKPRRGQIEFGERTLQRVAVEIVVKPRARPLHPIDRSRAGNVPSRQLRQDLPAQPRPAGAEEQDRPRTARQLVERGFRSGNIGRLVNDAQQLQP